MKTNRHIRAVLCGIGFSAATGITALSSNAVLTGIPALALGEAVDAPDLAWTVGGNASWIAQTAVTYDGVDAAQSGVITHSQETWMQTTVTGPGRLSFWWKVSSESGYDFLEFYINGALQSGRISGEVNWQQRTFRLGAGPQTLRWRYMKDVSVNSGQDRGWVDMVSFLPDVGPPTILTQPANPTVTPGATVSLCVEVSGAPPLSYQWQFNGADIPGATNACLTLTNVSAAQAGLYTVQVSNSFGAASASAVVSCLDLKMFAGLAIAGPTNLPYTVQYRGALDPTNVWQTITTDLRLPTSPHVWIDFDSPNARQRFYRAYPTR